MSNIMQKASNQLFSRPTDESYDSMEAIVEALESRERNSIEVNVNRDALNVVSSMGSLCMHDPKSDTEFGLNEWSFSQLCQNSRVPKAIVNTLTSETAARVLNERKRFYKSGNGKLLAQQGANGLTTRALYSESYARVPDLDVLTKVKDISNEGGFMPGGHIAGKSGVGISAEQATLMGIRKASGLYLGERDIFLFMISPAQTPVEGEDFYLGFFAENSEVKDGCLELTTYACDGVCANHMIWGARDEQKTRWVHRGDPNRIMFEFEMRLHKQVRSGQLQDELYQVVSSAKKQLFARDEDGVRTRLTGFGFPNAASEFSIKYSKNRFDDEWNNTFGVASGLTCYSQTRWNQDDRVGLDKKVGDMVSELCLN